MCYMKSSQGFYVPQLLQMILLQFIRNSCSVLLLWSSTLWLGGLSTLVVCRLSTFAYSTLVWHYSWLLVASFRFVFKVSLSFVDFSSDSCTIFSLMTFYVYSLKTIEAFCWDFSLEISSLALFSLARSSFFSVFTWLSSKS